MRIGLWALAIVLSPAAALAARLSADDILRKVDAVRMPQQDTVLTAEVVTERKGRPGERAVYEVLLKGNDRTRIQTLEPATDRGTTILMIQRDLWVYLPDVSKPVRISLQQRLLGDVAVGDLARANFVGDYTPKIVQTTATFYKLNLVAKSDDVTYSRVELWVDRKEFRPIRAAFYSQSGRLLKVGSYEDYALLAGMMRPSRLVFTDALTKGQRSTVRYDRLTESPNLPEKYFTKEYLKKSVQ